jgi:hypothetical protein
MNASRESIKPDAPIETLNVVLIDEIVLDDVLDWVSGCEFCDDDAMIPFDYLLDAVTDSDPTTTEYLMCRIETCPFCLGQVTEKTRVTVTSKL